MLRYLHFTQALPYTKISRLLPSITDLRNRYEVEPECAMALLRPRLRRALLHWDAADPPVALPDAAENGAVNRAEANEDVLSTQVVDGSVRGSAANGDARDHTLKAHTNGQAGGDVEMAAADNGGACLCQRHALGFSSLHCQECCGVVWQRHLRDLHVYNATHKQRMQLELQQCYAIHVL